MELLEDALCPIHSQSHVRAVIEIIHHMPLFATFKSDTN